jgi:hypothetical protein
MSLAGESRWKLIINRLFQHPQLETEVQVPQIGVRSWVKSGRRDVRKWRHEAPAVGLIAHTPLATQWRYPKAGLGVLCQPLCLLDLKRQQRQHQDVKALFIF